MTRPYPLAFIFCAAGILQAAGPPCPAVKAAVAKLAATPAHTYIIETAGYLRGKTRTSETIVVNGKHYLSVDGKWQMSGMSEQSRQEAEKTADEAQRNDVCQLTREDSVNGEAAVVYTIQHKDDDVNVVTQIWISKARGLPLKQEADIDLGGPAAKSHRSLRYDYSNVQAPVIK